MIAAAVLLREALREDDEEDVVGIEEGRPRIVQNDREEFNLAMSIVVDILYFFAGFLLYTFINCFIYLWQELSETNLERARLFLTPNDSFALPSGTVTYYNF